MKTMTLALAAFLAVGAARALADEKLIVHEWGTFTSFQDESGQAIGGINTDDEPVPSFVHRLGNLIQSSASLGNVYNKGFPSEHPQVTMRLETPVIYFHRAPGSAQLSVNVDVAFHGGWLTEFYPLAQTDSPGVRLTNDQLGVYAYGHLESNTIGKLSWANVRVGGGSDGPQTSDKVWTSPRQVKTDGVSVGDETEKFLFYRGVGHTDSPVIVSRGQSPDQLLIRRQPALDAATSFELAKSPMWLVNVGSDGSIDWNRIAPADASQPDRLLLGYADPYFLSPGNHNTGMESLHKDMATALASAGLFPDEAEAMLNTWQLSYFKSPGLRLFFLVPTMWTDAKLPLHISGNPAMTRVMVGRIEILTQEQELLVKQIESGPYERPTNVPGLEDVIARLSHGDPLASSMPNFPPDLQAYILLGRFRNALLSDQQRRHPNSVLAKFIADNQIGSRDLQ